MTNKKEKRFLKQALLVAFICTVSAMPAMAAPIVLPPVVEPVSQEQHIGKIIFVELATPDLAASKRFYGELLGWTFKDIQSGETEYSEAFHHGFPVAGLIHKELPADEHRQPAWLSFFSVRDVNAVTSIAVQNGAKVLFEPHDIPNRGEEAVIADPQGAVFAVLHSSSGDPQDVLVEPGEWIWNSLHTTDPDTDAAFYQKLFNYEVFDLSSGKSLQHLLLASDNTARASANPLPENKPHVHPHWLNYVRVDDADDMAEKVVALGGRVLVEPHKDRHGGKVAVVADPMGAPFGLFEWPDTESKEVSQ